MISCILNLKFILHPPIKVIVRGLFALVVTACCGCKSPFNPSELSGQNQPETLVVIECSDARGEYAASGIVDLHFQMKIKSEAKPVMVYNRPGLFNVVSLNHAISPYPGFFMSDEEGPESSPVGIVHAEFRQMEVDLYTWGLLKTNSPIQTTVKVSIWYKDQFHNVNSTTNAVNVVLKRKSP